MPMSDASSESAAMTERYERSSVMSSWEPRLRCSARTKRKSGR